MFKRHDLAIINRTFWPEGQVLGEALLQLGEKASAKSKDVIIITQHSSNLKEIAQKCGRGSNLLFRSCKLRSGSSSKLFMRIVDAVIFTLWVLWSLFVTRPNRIYISTDPPIIVPLIVLIYSKIYKASYIYHLQDIHPELTNIVVRLNPLLFSFLKKIDGLVMRHASSIITITQTMKDEIIARSNTKSDIYLIDNPAISFDGSVQLKTKGFVFSGNLGRLQRISLLLKSIDKYKLEGGILPFLFVGGGLYSNDAYLLSTKYEDVTYAGKVDAKKANELSSAYEWALLPIDDEATKYSFPSKTSSYLSCGLKLISVCSNQTSVAQWVLNNHFGMNSLPNIDDLVDVFFKIENGLTVNDITFDRDYFSINRFVQNIYNVVFDIKKVMTQ
jgi:glycosyltransferase involved in cell wall biosynthesis